MDIQELAAAEQRWLDLWASGPQRLRWDRIPLQVGDAAPDLELLDHTGASIRLSSLWTDQTAVILFWRHFGCSCGRDRAPAARRVHRAHRARLHSDDHRSGRARALGSIP